MEPVAKPSVTPAQIRDDWAKRGHAVSRQYVSRLITKGVGGEKLPTTDLEAAWSFRTQRTDISKLAGGGGASGGEQNQRRPAGHHGAPPSAESEDSLDSMLTRVREMEMLAAKRWQERLNAKTYDAILAESAERAWKAAARTRTEVETLVAAHKKKLGLIVEISEAQRLVDERLSPLRSGLHGFDRELAKSLFPEDPARMRPVIRSVIVRALLPAIARAKQRMRAAPPNDLSRSAA